MRPEKLVIRAFGPFAEEQVIDFTAFWQRAMFLIHGPIGAGKTAILDALCFALYGESSGGERDGRQMRSHFAAEDTMTEVALTFVLGAKRYTVVRSPEQERPKKRGIGMTVAEAAATLSYHSDRGDRIVASRWNDVTEKVSELLGFRCEQFRHVVVIPQGKFRRLLASSSRERQRILEDLFHTEWFGIIADALKGRAISLSERMGRLQEAKQLLLSRESCATVEECQQKRHTLHHRVEECRDALQKVRTDEEALQKRLAHARLAMQQAEAYSHATKELTVAQKAMAAATAEKESAEKLFQELQQKEEHRVATIRELERLSAAKEGCVALREQKKALSEVEDKILFQAESIAAMEQAIAEVSRCLERRKELMREYACSAAMVAPHSSSVVSCETALNNCERHAVAKKRQEKAQLRCKKNRQLLFVAEEAFTQKKAACEQWQYNQRAELAGTLVYGEPCPVCGSCEHPEPAHDGFNSIQKAIPLATLKQALSESEQKCAALRDVFAADTAVVAAAKAEVAILAALAPEEKKAIEERLSQAKKRLADAEDAQKRFIASERSLQKDEADAVTARDALRRAEKILAELSQKRAAHEAAIKLSLKRIPEGIDNEDAVITAVATAEKWLNEYTLRSQQIRKQHQAAASAYAACQERLMAVQERLDSCPKIDAPPIVPLEKEQNTLQNKREEVSRTLGALIEKIASLDAVLSSCANYDAQLAALQYNYAIATTIADVANGRNPLGITFQRFVLSTILDQVVDIASRRLAIMSHGRYDLVRSMSRKDRRYSGGLDLEVFDHYTGTQRPTCTLSGGESFLASLSLALSLADVVQSTAGGVRIDTIFIDEGFGSLDSEALDIALTVLNNLHQHGRLVGIISHVPELLEHIPTRLEITYSHSGSVVGRTLHSPHPARGPLPGVAF